MTDWEDALKNKIADCEQDLDSNAIDIRACEFKLATLKEKRLELKCSLNTNENRLKSSQRE